MQPDLFVFMGLVASGKSTLAQAFAQKKSFSYFNSDVVRKELAGKLTHSRQGSDFDQGIYTLEFSRKTYDALLELARNELLHRQSVVLDGSYHKRDERKRLVKCAESCGCSVHFILCFCDDVETRRRLDSRLLDPQAVSDGDWQVYLRQKEIFEYPDELLPSMFLSLDTTKSLPQLLKVLEKHFLSF